MKNKNEYKTIEISGHHLKNLNEYLTEKYNILTWIKMAFRYNISFAYNTFKNLKTIKKNPNILVKLIVNHDTFCKKCPKKEIKDYHAEFGQKPCRGNKEDNEIYLGKYGFIKNKKYSSKKLIEIVSNLKIDDLEITSELIKRRA